MYDLQKMQNKKSESYSSLFTENKDILKRDKGRKRWPIKAKRRNERRKQMRRDIDKKLTEARKQHIRNRSDYEMTRDQICILSKALKLNPYTRDEQPSHKI